MQSQAIDQPPSSLLQQAIDEKNNNKAAADIASHTSAKTKLRSPVQYIMTRCNRIHSEKPLNSGKEALERNLADATPAPRLLEKPYLRVDNSEGGSKRGKVPIALRQVFAST
jgi:hypothetical protein